MRKNADYWGRARDGKDTAVPQHYVVVMGLGMQKCRLAHEPDPSLKLRDDPFPRGFQNLRVGLARLAQKLAGEPVGVEIVFGRSRRDLFRQIAGGSRRRPLARAHVLRVTKDLIAPLRQ